jgi:hypothetical protein
MDKNPLPIERLERRLNLLRRLAQSLEDAQEAIVHRDLEKLEQQTSNQAQLCDAWQRLECAASPVDAEGDSASQPYVRIEKQTREIEGRVRHLVRVHAALLRGAQDSLAVLANLLLQAEGTYEASNPIDRPVGGHKENIQCRI